MPTTTRPAAPDAAVATHISGIRMTRHVARLLEHRDRLALYVTERESHNLDDAHDAFMAMVAVEDQLAVQAPQVHARLFAAWAAAHEAIAHEPGEFNARCGICRGLASATANRAPVANVAPSSVTLTAA